MKILYRALVSLLAMLATLLLTDCSGAPGCGPITFGSSTCSTSGSGGGGTFGGGGGTGGGGGGSTTAAFVYAVDQAGTIDGYALATPSGTLAAISGYTAPVIPANNGGVGMVVAQTQFLYAGIAGSGLLYGWTIGSTGSLTAISGSPYAAAFLADYVGGVGQSNMTTDPAGKYLFISDTLLGEVFVYQIGTGGALTAATGSPFVLPAAFQAMNLATDGQGKYLYVVNGAFSTHTGSQVAAFTIGSGGALTVVQGSPFNFPMWLLKGEPTGQFLVGTSGMTAFDGVSDDKNLYVFSITQSGTNAGAITELVPQSTTYAPYTIAVQSNTSGDLVYSFGFNDTATAFNPVEGFGLSTTGTLSADSGEPFTLGEGSWGQFDQSGAYLFSYASFLDATTNTTVTQIAPLFVGSGGALSQPGSPLVLATPGFWVATDPQ